MSSQERLVPFLLHSATPQQDGASGEVSEAGASGEELRTRAAAAADVLFMLQFFYVDVYSQSQSVSTPTKTVVTGVNPDSRYCLSSLSHRPTLTTLLMKLISVHSDRVSLFIYFLSAAFFPLCPSPLL